MHILLATTNPAKVARVRQLTKGLDFVFFTPQEAGIESIATEEGSDIFENAERKTRAYFGKTKLPVLGMDSAFVIPNENADPAMVRRNALAGRDETKMSTDEIAQAMISFYQELVLRRGGRLPAYWEDALALITPDGLVKKEQSRRPVILTDKIYPPINPHLPLRCMYIVEATGKYTAEQAPEEELVEMRPYKQALERLLSALR